MSNIEAHIAEIRAMDLPSLRDAWRRHHRAPPPRRTQPRVCFAPGHRLPAFRNRPTVGSPRPRSGAFGRLAKAFAETGRVAPRPGTTLRPGARRWCDRAQGKA